MNDMHGIECAEGLKARHVTARPRGPGSWDEMDLSPERAIRPKFRPYRAGCDFGHVTRACGPGCNLAGFQPVAALDAESAEVLENIKALLK